MRGTATDSIGKALFACTVIGVLIFLFAPLVVVVGASFDGGENAFINFPPRQLSLSWYWSIPSRYFETLLVSVLLAAASAAVAIVLGVPAALALVRSRMPGLELAAALFRAPLQIPFVVIGVAFLQAYYLAADIVGLNLIGSFTGLLLAHVFIAMPYVIGTTTAVLRRFNVRFEEAALILGASRWSAFRKVTLPIVAPGIYVGALYAFIISFSDVPISLFLASPRYTTFPVEVFHSMEFDFNPAILAISTLILAISVAMLWLVQRAVGIDAMLRTGSR
jgi:putative spermidine/putrescine transport system permease protein